MIERRDEITRKIIDHYSKKSERLERIINEIESDPKVIERLWITAEKEMKKDLEEMRIKEQKLLEEQEKILVSEAQSVYDRQINGDKRWDALFGSELSTSELKRLLKNYKEAQDIGDEEKITKTEKEWLSALKRAKKLWYTAIIDGEGDKQIKEPKEFIPREMKSSIDYTSAINDLRNLKNQEILKKRVEQGSKNAQRVLDMIEDIKLNDELDKALFGKKWEKWHKEPTKRKLGLFWAAFELRKKNDKAGITKKHKEERLKKRKERN